MLKNNKILIKNAFKKPHQPIQNNRIKTCCDVALNSLGRINGAIPITAFPLAQFYWRKTPMAQITIPLNSETLYSSNPQPLKPHNLKPSQPSNTHTHSKGIVLPMADDSFGTAPVKTHPVGLRQWNLPPPRVEGLNTPLHKC